MLRNSWAHCPHVLTSSCPSPHSPPGQDGEEPLTRGAPPQKVTWAQATSVRDMPQATARVSLGEEPTALVTLRLQPCLDSGPTV